MEGGATSQVDAGVNEVVPPRDGLPPTELHDDRLRDAGINGGAHATCKHGMGAVASYGGMCKERDIG